MMYQPTPLSVDCRMALMNLQLALRKLQGVRDELQETRDEPDTLHQVRTAIIRVSGAIQEVERI